MTPQSMFHTSIVTLGEDPMLKAWLRTPSATEFGKDTDSMYMWLF